LTAAWW